MGARCHNDAVTIGAGSPVVPDSIGAAEASISRDELARHTLSNTLAYSRDMGDATIVDRARICLQFADFCMTNGLELRALGCLLTALRLGVDNAGVAGGAAELEARVEAQRPMARVVPAGFRIVWSYAEEFARTREAGRFPPGERLFRTTPVGAALQQLRFGDKITDLSFIVLRHDTPMVLVRCDLRADLGITDGECPVRIVASPAAQENRLHQCVSIALDVLIEIGERHGASDILVEDTFSPEETLVGRAALARAFLPEVHVHGIVDLTLSEDAIWRNVRKSFRPIITAARAEITVKYFNYWNQDEQVVAEWLRLLTVTPHATNEATVRFISEMAFRGEAEIAIGYSSDGACCGLTAVYDDGDASLYYAGHFLEEGEAKKQGHLMLFDAIMRAKLRGRARFYLFHDDWGPARYVTDGFLGTKTGKWSGVHEFKRGFADTVERILVYRKPL